MSIVAESELAEKGWKKEFSKKYGAYYWFNSLDGRKSWEVPVIERDEVKLIASEDGGGAKKRALSLDDSSATKKAAVAPFTAIIVSHYPLHSMALLLNFAGSVQRSACRAESQEASGTIRASDNQISRQL